MVIDTPRVYKGALSYLFVFYVYVQRHVHCQEPFNGCDFNTATYRVCEGWLINSSDVISRWQPAVDYDSVVAAVSGRSLNYFMQYPLFPVGSETAIHPSSLTSIVYFRASHIQCLAFSFRVRQAAVGASLTLHYLLSSGRTALSWRHVVTQSAVSLSAWQTVRPLVLPTKDDFRLSWTAAGFSSGYADGAFDLDNVSRIYCNVVELEQIQQCTFSSGATCGWTTKEWSNAARLPRAGARRRFLADHTSGNRTGFFLAPKHQLGRVQYTTISSQFSPIIDRCMSFYTRLFSNSQLVVQVSTADRRWPSLVVMDRKNRWTRHWLPIPDNQNFVVKLKFVRKKKWRKRHFLRAAVDDVQFLPCQKELNCDFEFSHCHFKRSQSGSLAGGWTIRDRNHLEQMFSANTEPTFPGKVAVVFFPISDSTRQEKLPQQTFHLISPLLAPSQTKCLLFTTLLQSYSPNQNHSLSLHLQHRVSDDYLDLIKISTTSQNRPWSTSVAFFHSSSAFSFVFSASAHGMMNGVILVDNVTTLPLCQQAVPGAVCKFNKLAQCDWSAPPSGHHVWLHSAVSSPTWLPRSFASQQTYLLSSPLCTRSPKMRRFQC